VILYFLLLYAGVDFSKRCTTLLFLLAKLVVDLIFRLFTCLFALIASAPLPFELWMKVYFFPLLLTSLLLILGIKVGRIVESCVPIDAFVKLVGTDVVFCPIYALSPETYLSMVLLFKGFLFSRLHFILLFCSYVSLLL